MLRDTGMLNRIRLLMSGVALALALAPVCGFAQAPTGQVPADPSQLPSASEPQTKPWAEPNPATEPKTFAELAKTEPLAANTDSMNGGGQEPTDPAIHEPAAAPLVAMAPHPENSLWWISGQANIIIQGDLPFHSPYAGTNSFIARGEYKTSLVGTLYGAVRRSHSIRWNTDFILDLESAGGRGLSEALGLAGFTNLDVVRNPNLGPVPYLARYGIHQVLGLTQRTATQEAGPFGLAPSVPLRRFEIRVGKLTLPDFFDINGPGSDSHLQFMNWTVDNNGAWDYAADTRGYTVGGMVEYDDVNWSIRYGLFAMPTVANGIDMDWAFSRAHGGNAEFELRQSLLKNRKGVRRLLYRLHNELKLPVYCLLDNDPWGYYIYSVLKQGSINLAYESKRMAIPDAKFIGLRSIDFERCILSNSVKISLSDTDRKRAKQIAEYPWFATKKAWQKEIDLMIRNDFKLEVEALISKDISYVTETYVPERLAEQDWLD